MDAIGSRSISNTNADVSLYRKDIITQPTSTFNISEWDSYANNYCQNLGILSTSTTELLAEKEFKIYPNPVHDYIFVSGKSENIQTAQIVDYSGQLIYTEKNPFKNKKNISVQNLKTGSYLLKLDDKAYPFIKK